MRISFVYRFKGSGFKGSGFSAAAGSRSRSRRFYRKSDPGLAEFHKRMKNRISNIEGRRKEFYRYSTRLSRSTLSFSILSSRPKGSSQAAVGCSAVLRFAVQPWTVNLEPPTWEPQTLGTVTKISSFNLTWQGEPAAIVLDSQLSFIYIILVWYFLLSEESILKFTDCKNECTQDR